MCYTAVKIGVGSNGEDVILFYEKNKFKTVWNRLRMLFKKQSEYY